MRRLIFKFIMISLVIFAFASCKTFTYVNDSSNGIKITLPKGAQKVDTFNLKNKYSNRFYQVFKSGHVHSWGHNFSIKNKVVLAFDYTILDENKILDEKGQKERLNILLYVTKSDSGKVPPYKYVEINRNKFLLIFYQKDNNTDDYFVTFETARTKARVITGLIRFPATMSLEEIEKQTIKILSGVKLKN